MSSAFQKGDDQSFFRQQATRAGIPRALALRQASMAAFENYRELSFVG
jgi:hypothetical protein